MKLETINYETNNDLKVYISKKRLIKYSQKFLGLSNWKEYWSREYVWDDVDELVEMLGSKVKVVEVG